MDTARVCFRRAFSLLLAALFLMLSVNAFGLDEPPALAEYMQTVYNDANQLPGSEANTVLQTGDGYLWFGSYGGLRRYDGTNLLSMHAEELGVSSFSTRVLFEDSAGRLWIGTNDMGLFYYQDGVFHKYEADLGLIANSVRAITQDLDGNLYVGSAGALSRLDTQLVASSLRPPTLSSHTFGSLACDRQGALWGATLEGALFCVRSGETVLTATAEALDGVEPMSVACDSAGRVLVGGNGSDILILRQIDDSYRLDEFDRTLVDTGAASVINTLYEDSTHRIWVCADTALGYLDTADDFHLAEGARFSGFFTAICEDYEHNLWLASNREGVLELTRSKLFSANFASGLSGVTVNATARYRGELFVATDTGLTVLDDDFRPVDHELSALLEGVRVRSLAVDRWDRLWVCTYNRYGVLCWDGSKWQSLTAEKSGLAGDRTRCFLELSDGKDVAVGTTSGLSILRDGEVLRSYKAADGLPNEYILCMYEDAQGRLVLGTDGGGIVVLGEEGVEALYSSRDGLSSDVILRMVPDEHFGGVWISTGTALNYWDEGGFRVVSDGHESSGSIFDLKLIGEHLWILRGNAVVIAGRQALLSGSGLSPARLDKSNGLTGTITSNSWHWLEGNLLYLATGDGVYRADTQHTYMSTVPPKVVVNAVVADGRTIPMPRGRVTLPSDTKTLSIDFAVLGFTAGECTARYYLEGFDRTPLSAPQSQLTPLRYTNLAGGTYRFHLAAVNADGVPSAAECVLTLEKRLAIWERPSFIGGVLLALVLCVVLLVRGIFKIKTRRLLARQQEYRDITLQALTCIANTIDYRDRYTGGHSLRVAAYSREIYRRLGKSELEQENIYYAALLHDIGKIGIPDKILNKPQQLTLAEYEVMQQHPRIGGDILKDFSAIPNISEGARYHHEHADGTGYNEHLHADDIPLIALVIGVADALDAMTSARIYRTPPLSDEQAKAQFAASAGQQFDAHIAQIAIEMIDEGIHHKIDALTDPAPIARNW